LKYLLDTHVFLWWLHQPSKLTHREIEVIEDPQNLIFVSAVVAWESVIKQSLGKLIFRGSISDAIEENKFSSLPISIAHTLELKNLPMHHHDPFDRLLICQAKVEKMVLLSHDKKIPLYQVNLLKA
jgi:PIN domain nuclease of toxin-antitoxin system